MKIIWNLLDKAFIDILHIYQRFQAPIELFDETIKWLKKHSDVLFDKNRGILHNAPSRATFVKNMYKQCYGHQYCDAVKPKVMHVPMNVSKYEM